MSITLKKRLNWYQFRLIKKLHDILLWVDSKIAKSKAVWAFPVCYLNHQLFDNARPIFENIKNNADITKVVLYRGKTRPQIQGEKVHIVKLNSILGFWWLFRSGVVFVRHCVIQDIGIPVVNSRRLVVNLFHGIALKNIGIQVSPDSITGCDPFGAIISSSDADKQTMLSSFKSSTPQNVWITGLPRNDLLFFSEEELWPEAKDELKKVERRLSGKKLILFAPTFRASWENWSGEGGFYKFSKEELDELDAIAKQYDAVIGVRTHIREERSVLESFAGLDVLVFNDIVEPALVLKKTHVLISDYSSIVVDFLLLRRPVLSFAFDYETYKKGKGFLYNLEDVFPSPLCFTFNELRSGILSALKNIESSHVPTKYQKSIDLFHRFPDGKSTQRVLEKIDVAMDNLKTIN